MTEQYQRPCIPLWDNSDLEVPSSSSPLPRSNSNLSSSSSPTTPRLSSGAHPLVSSSPRKLDRCQSMYNFTNNNNSSNSNGNSNRKSHELRRNNSNGTIGVHTYNRIKQQAAYHPLQQAQKPSSPRYMPQQSASSSPSSSPRTPKHGGIYSTSCPSVPSHLIRGGATHVDEYPPYVPTRPRSISSNPPLYNSNYRPVNIDAVNMEANLLNQRANEELQRKMSVLQNLKTALNTPPPTPRSASGRLESFPSMDLN